MTWECDYSYNLVTGKDWKCKEEGKCESWHEPTQGHFDNKHIMCAQLGSVQFINFNIKLSTFVSLLWFMISSCMIRVTCSKQIHNI